MKDIYDVIIIGGGPAGMSAGIYAVRYGMSTLVVEKGIVGGIMNTTTEIKNFPSYIDINGQELSQKMKDHFASYNGEILYGEVVSIDFDNKTVNTKSKSIKYKTIIIATGSTNRKLELDKEKELTGHGISYCAVCDGFFFKDKVVTVVGSGSGALEDAVYLADLAKKVNIVSKHEKFVGQEILVNQLKQKQNVDYYMGYMPSKIIGEDVLEKVEIQGKLDKKVLPTDGMFIQIGHKPDNDLFKDRLELSRAGFVVADSEMRTNLDGVFVAGDIRDKSLRQIVTACSDGAIAANSAFKYIQNMED